ncbi:MAG: hypothetical protein ACLTOJ_07445 [[Clostridium] symbiosum]
MKEIKLLDCTLRDGGFVNDWEFGYGNIINIFERLISSGVDVLEIGFLDDRRPFDKNRTIMPDTKSADDIFGRLDKGNAMIVAMIDYGTCRIENLAPAPNPLSTEYASYLKTRNERSHCLLPRGKTARLSGLCPGGFDHQLL